MPGFKRTIIDIPGSGSAFLPILAIATPGYIKAVESLLTSTGAPNTLQGFNYQLPNDGFTQELNIPANVVLEIGDPAFLSTRRGNLGSGPQTLGMGLPPTPATKLFQARSATATGTSIEVTEYS